MLHDDDGTIRRPSASRAWIICLLDFKERRRTLLTPGRYTELFFLDEATALAAGHRPCFECRRDRAVAYRDAWRRRPGRAADDVTAIDAELAEQRRVPRSGLDDGKIARRAALASMPDGAIAEVAGRAWLRHDDGLRPWSHDGYGPPRVIEPDEVGWVLTPPATLAALTHGYRPELHPTVDDPV